MRYAYIVDTTNEASVATLSDLVNALSNVTGLPEATVFAYGRFAREAGLIAQKGRGRGAAIMQASDAANLLIGIGGTDVTREAARAIRTYRPMKGVVFRDHQRGFVNAFAEWWKPLGFEPRGDSSGEPQKCVFKSDFGRLLEFLILEAGLGNLTQWLFSLPPGGAGIGSGVQLNIIFQRPEPSVTVELRNIWGRAFEIWVEPKRRQQTHRALRRSTTVTQDCLTALGLVLAGKIEPKQLKSPEALAQIYKNQAEDFRVKKLPLTAVSETGDPS